MAGETILIVDDDSELRRLIADFLRGHGYLVEEAGDVPGLRLALARSKPDLVVLDVMMPGEDGLAGLRTMPQPRPPVIFLSALSDETDRIVGLEMGGDDYLSKPCNPRELLARIRAVLRRGPTDPGGSGVLEFEGWRLDPASWSITDPAGQPVALTSGELRLLAGLARSGQKVLSRDTLAALLGHDSYESYDRAIDIAVSRLRRKLAEHGGEDLIRTVRGEGYAMAVAVRGA